ncbi:MAG: hypothetical protein DI536_20560 [Archangium gephyra]|uniref:Uncharacterized protein n=1 Tax=Archangium gephyra TaxID=48 RepID=A0A2W5T440_9BACT|nr:MAG: hypothetical protein DI536_20560 [Archangium gephyra]
MILARLDAGLQQHWSISPLCCYTTEGFSPIDVCVTHAIYLRVSATHEGGSSQFDYSLGSGIRAGQTVDTALTVTLSVALELARDAGFQF